MRQPVRINIQIVLAIICVLAGCVILWRSFARPASTVASLARTGVPSVTEIRPSATPQATKSAPTSPPATATIFIPPTNTPAPTIVVPTTAIVLTSLPQPTNTVAVQPSPIVASPVATQILPTATFAPTIPPSLLASPTPFATVTNVVVTPTPTTLNATAVGATATLTPIPTAPAGSTATPTPVATTVVATASNNATIVYRVTGAASKVVVSYLEANGNEKTIEVTLPWQLQLSAAVDADLAVDAFSQNDEKVQLSCVIEINGVAKVTDQTNNAVNGVACERFAP